jgi:hypothetical protein
MWLQRQGDHYYGNEKEISFYLTNFVGCIQYYYAVGVKKRKSVFILKHFVGCI